MICYDHKEGYVIRNVNHLIIMTMTVTHSLNGVRAKAYTNQSTLDVSRNNTK
jgi:hypothetical protein